MEACEKCVYLSECKSLNIPNKIIARVIDLIANNSDDTVIETTLMNEFNITIEIYGYSIKMLRKYLLRLENECLQQRKQATLKS